MRAKRTGASYFAAFPQNNGPMLLHCERASALDALDYFRRSLGTTALNGKEIREPLGHVYMGPSWVDLAARVNLLLHVNSTWSISVACRFRRG